MKFNKKYVKNIISAVILLVLFVLLIMNFTSIIGACWYVFGIFIPFILAYIISIPASPFAEKLKTKYKIPKQITAIFAIIAFVGIIGGILTAIIWKIIDEIKSIYMNFPQIWANITYQFENFSKSFENLYTSLPYDVKEFIDNSQNSITTNMTLFLKTHYKPLVFGAGNMAKALPSIFIGIIVFILALYFFISNGNAIVKKVGRKTVPLKIRSFVSKVSDEIKKYLGGYLKAQLILMSIVFIIMFAGLSILKVNYAMIIALCVAILDALPFFGSGAVLWPWSLVSFINANIKMGVALIIIYLCVIITRQLLEPKIVSSSVGVNPILTLLSMYIGYKVFSIGGMILGPIILIVIISFYKAGAFNPLINYVKKLLAFIVKQIKELFSYIQIK